MRFLISALALIALLAPQAASAKLAGTPPSSPSVTP